MSADDGLSAEIVWLRDTLIAARLAAVDNRDLRAMRWQIFEASKTFETVSSQAPSDAAPRCANLPFSDSVTDTDQDLACFASWFQDIPVDQRRSLPSSLRNAARILVRHRGFRVHKVPKGKCSRVTEQITSAFMLAGHPSREIDASTSASDSDRGHADSVAPFDSFYIG